MEVPISFKKLHHSITIILLPWIKTPTKFWFCTKKTINRQNLYQLNQMMTGSFLLPVTQPVKYIERKIVKGRGGASGIFLRQSNSEGKDPVVLPTPKKVDSPKQKRNAGEVSNTSDLTNYIRASLLLSCWLPSFTTVREVEREIMGHSKPASKKKKRRKNRSLDPIQPSSGTPSISTSSPRFRFPLFLRNIRCKIRCVI